jgi:hypothetical protein
VFSRSNGHSAVAAAAYRSGSKLFDERTHKLHHYSNRLGVANSFILLPEETPAEFFQSSTEQNISLSGLPDRAYLWNAAEKADNRRNSRTARELVLALPHELSEKDRQALTRDMAGWLMERYRVAVDAAIHKPIEEHNDDPRNHHAHILFSTRQMGEGGFGAKTRVLDDRKTGVEETEIIREVWEVLANDALKRAGRSDVQIDRRSLEDQGIDRIPEIHEGKSGHMDSNPRPSEKDNKLKSNSDEPEVNSSEAKDHSHKSESKEEQGKATESGEEEEEGDDDSSSGSSGDSGGLSPTMDLKPDKVSDELDNIISENSNYEYRNNEKLTRAELNKEIKRLNAVRAGFDDIPLKDQIAYIDKLMAKLDTRLNHLEKISKRSSLTSQLQKSLKSLVNLSQEILTTREVTTKILSLSVNEKEARSVRQLKRYGRTYRAGVHAQIREMKQNLSILQSKQLDYERYNRFVEKVESSIYDLKLESKSPISTSSKFTSAEAVASKIHNEAKLKRAKLASDIGIERTAPKTSNHSTTDNIRNDQSKTIISTARIIKTPTPENPTLDTKLKVKSQVIARGRHEKLSSSFVKEVKIDKSVLSKDNPKWRTPPKDGAPIFDPIKKARVSNASSKSSKSSHRSEQSNNGQRPWVTPNSEKMDPLTETINKKQAQERADSRDRADSKPDYDMNTAKGQFNASNDPKSAKRTTREAYRSKTSAEADIMRSNIPPEFRAEPYPPKDNQYADTDKGSIKDKVKSGFKDATSVFKDKWSYFRGSTQDNSQNTSNTEQEHTKPTMSSGFNKASFEGGDQSEMNDKPSTQDRKPRNERY